MFLVGDAARQLARSGIRTHMGCTENARGKVISTLARMPMALSTWRIRAPRNHCPPAHKHVSYRLFTGSATKRESTLNAS